MQRLWATFRSLSLPSQVGVVVGILVVLALVSGGIGSLVSAYKDRAFDKREAEREQQREVLEDERNRAVGRAEAAEARAKELESQTRILEVMVDANGKRAEQIKGVVQDEERKMQEENSNIDADIDSCERVKRICTRLQSLGYLAKGADCPCQ